MAKKQEKSKRVNPLDHDPLVVAIFTAVNQGPGDYIEKISAIVRAGNIALAYLETYRTTREKILSATFTTKRKHGSQKEKA